MIRDATPADLDGIMAIENASFPTDAWSSDAMRVELDSIHSHYVVWDVDGEIRGYAGVRAVRGARDADIQTIAVAADARGRGDGRRLLHAARDRAAAAGARELFLEVRADNPVAHALYLSEGFAEIGRRARYYQPDDVDAIVMRAPLEPAGVTS